MKLSLSRTRSSPIGLHLGPRFVTLVQVSGPAERTGVVAVAQGLLPAREKLTEPQHDEQISIDRKSVV